MNTNEAIIDRLASRLPEQHRPTPEQRESILALLDAIGAQAREHSTEHRPDPLRGARLGELIGDAAAEAWLKGTQDFDQARSTEALS